MNYNALIIDSALTEYRSEIDEIQVPKKMTCELTVQTCLSTLFEAADQMNERPCRCLVITDRDDLARIALLGGFDVAGSEAIAGNDY